MKKYAISKLDFQITYFLFENCAITKLDFQIAQFLFKFVAEVNSGFIL